MVKLEGLLLGGARELGLAAEVSVPCKPSSSSLYAFLKFLVYLPEVQDLVNTWSS
jgi:hypothetical protein